MRVAAWSVGEEWRTKLATAEFNHDNYDSFSLRARSRKKNESATEFVRPAIAFKCANERVFITM